eukprot:TRINITY_DN64159_c0_g2_i1.p1 TRINITY_DN64159_c0_g2~~TRINITY_DN64159_c0_g2_i1.p1  ORF type:complete len:269 (-),score=20.81 TRINITY_DN64159_c0_g2_i1:154-960(-)
MTITSRDGWIDTGFRFSGQLWIQIDPTNCSLWVPLWQHLRSEVEVPELNVKFIGLHALRDGGVGGAYRSSRLVIGGDIFESLKQQYGNLFTGSSDGWQLVPSKKPIVIDFSQLEQVTPCPRKITATITCEGMTINNETEVEIIEDTTCEFPLVVLGLGPWPWKGRWFCPWALMIDGGLYPYCAHTAVVNGIEVELYHVDAAREPQFLANPAFFHQIAAKRNELKSQIKDQQIEATQSADKGPDPKGTSHFKLQEAAGVQESNTKVKAE